MVSIGSDNIKAEKAKAMKRYNRLKVLLRLFRVIELFAALFLLSRLSSQLPLVLKVFGECLGKLVAVLISPLFMFLSGNVIVFTLLSKSGHVFPQPWAAGDMEEYGESHIHEFFCGLENNGAEEVEYEDKEMIISEVNTVASPNHDHIANIDSDLNSAKSLRRSRSESLERECDSCKKTSTKLLRRSETEKSQKAKVSSETPMVSELNSEEFQKTIEEFIAKQVKLHKEEKLAIVGFNL